MHDGPDSFIGIGLTIWTTIRLTLRLVNIHRIEVITGAGRRRRWSAKSKARILAVSFAGEASVSEVARRHGLRPHQLFGWRHHGPAWRSGRQWRRQARIRSGAGQCIWRWCAAVPGLSAFLASSAVEIMGFNCACSMPLLGQEIGESFATDERTGTIDALFVGPDIFFNSRRVQLATDRCHLCNKSSGPNDFRDKAKALSSVTRPVTIASACVGSNSINSSIDLRALL
jgi:hypothetical protein